MKQYIRHPYDNSSVLTWRPRAWQDICGNRRVVGLLRKLSEKVNRPKAAGARRISEHQRLLITGASRSGKTASNELFSRSLLCQQLDLETLSPCDFRCDVCRMDWHDEGIRGLGSVMWGNALHRSSCVSYIPVDCTRINSAELDEKLSCVEGDNHAVKIVFIDEVHRLVRPGLAEKLLKVVEQSPAIWIAATAKPQLLESMFLNRFTKLATELPTSDEMNFWLVRRCEEFGISYSPEGVSRLIERSNRIPGTALHCLNQAQTCESALTEQFVDEEWAP